MERTLILLKPDAVQRGLVGPLLTRFEQRGLRFAALKLVQVSEALARRHYAAHEGKPFFPGLIAYIAGGALGLLSPRIGVIVYLLIAIYLAIPIRNVTRLYQRKA